MSRAQSSWAGASKGDLAMRDAYLVGSSRASWRAARASARPPTSCHPSIPPPPPCRAAQMLFTNITEATAWWHVQSLGLILPSKVSGCMDGRVEDELLLYD